MSSTFRIGRIGGTDIEASWTWPIVASLLMWWLARLVFPETNPGLSSSTYVAMGGAATLLVFSAIVLHELGHLRQARREGMQVGGVTLWALGGVARFTSMFPSPWAELRVAIAGPLVSLFLGIGCVALAAILRPGSAVDGVVAWLGYINLLLFAFNLVPALPMDGGRVLRALLWRARNDLAWATVVAAGVGSILGGAMVIVGLLSAFAGAAANGLWLAFIGLFVMLAGSAEAQTVVVRSALAGRRVRDAIAWTAAGGPPPHGMPQVDPDADLARTIAALLQSGANVAAVVDDGTLVGFLDVLAVLRGARMGRPAGLARS